jgi:putative phosphoserine phosphatase/1-acylglycerol-3-phosphate O-acyltransferase
VNPDPRLRAVATLRRWPVLYLDVPPGVPKLFGLEPFDVVRALARPQLMPYARFDIAGVERIPAEGGAIVVANHRSYFDVAALGLTAAKRARPLRFLGKKEVFDAPVVGPLARALGGIRVERGSGSDEPLREAARALEGGQLVAVLPQGTIPRGRAFFDPVLKGRTGAARLAAMTGAPVIPVGVWGTEHVWPRSARLPRVTSVFNPPTVRVRVGLPVTLDLGDAQVDTEAIMDAIVALLPPEARRAVEPTTEEVARAMPPGATAGAASSA